MVSAPGRLMFSVAAANVTVAMATGIATQVGVIDTTSVGWIHHVLYGSALITTAAALATARRAERQITLGAAAIVLSGMPRTKGGRRPHAIAAGVVSACYLAAARFG